MHRQTIYTRPFDNFDGHLNGQRIAALHGQRHIVEHGIDRPRELVFTGEAHWLAAGLTIRERVVHEHLVRPRTNDIDPHGERVTLWQAHFV